MSLDTIDSGSPSPTCRASCRSWQIEYLVSQGCVQILSDLLGESSMVMMALEGIERVLSVGDLRVVRSAIASHSHAEQVRARRCDTHFFVSSIPRLNLEADRLMPVSCSQSPSVVQ